MPFRSTIDTGISAQTEEGLIDLTNVTSPMERRGRTNEFDETERATVGYTTASAATNNNTTNNNQEEEDEDDYVPPGLADFVSAVNRTLEQNQHDFFNDTNVPNLLRTTTNDDDNDTLPTLLSMTHINMSATPMTPTTAATQQSYDEMEYHHRSSHPKGHHLTTTTTTTPMVLLQPSLTTEDDQLYRNQILQCSSVVGGGGGGLATPAAATLAPGRPLQTPSSLPPPVQQYAPSSSSTRETRPDTAAAAAAKEATSMTTSPFMMSPDMFLSPPPNPVLTMTDTEIQRQALGDEFRHDLSQSSPALPPLDPTVPGLGGATTPTVLSFASPEPLITVQASGALPMPPNHTVSSPAVAPAVTAAPLHSAVTDTTTPSTSHSLLGVQLESQSTHLYEQKQTRQSHDLTALNLTAQSTTLQSSNVLDANSTSTLLPDQKNLMELLSTIGHTTSKDTSQSSNVNGDDVAREPNKCDTNNDSVPMSSLTPPRCSVSNHSDDTATPSPLSMSSPSKSSIQAQQQEQAFTEQLRTNPRLRGSSPVYGLAPAPEEQLTLAQRLASDAERYGLPHPSPETAVTGPPPPLLSPSLTTAFQPRAISFQSLKSTKPGVKDIHPATTTIQTNAKTLPVSSGVTTAGRVTSTKPQLSIVTTPSPSQKLDRSTVSKPTSASKSVSTRTHIRDSSPLSTAAKQAISQRALQSESMKTNGHKPSLTTSSNGTKVPPKSQQTEQTRTTSRMPSPISELLNKPSLPLVKSKPNNERVTSNGSATSAKPSPPQISVQHQPGVSKPIATSSSLNAVNVLSTPSPLSMASHGDKLLSSKNSATLHDATSPSLGTDDGPNYSVETPSPLSMSSPKFESLSRRINESTSNNSPASTTSLPPPRFSPPSARRVKTSARFTAETANRLAKPVVKTPPPSELTPQSTKRHGSARFTSDSANRLSTTKTKTPPPPLFSNSLQSLSKVTPRHASKSGKSLSTPQPPVNSRMSQEVLHRPLTTTPARPVATTPPQTSTPTRPVAATPPQNSKIVVQAISEGGKDKPTPRQEALSRSIAFAANGDQNLVDLPVLQVSPRRFETAHIYSSQHAPSTDGQVHSRERDNTKATPSYFPHSLKAESPLRVATNPDHTLVSPAYFTTDTADRLMKPTFARNVAIISTITRRQSSDKGGGEPNMEDRSEKHEAYISRASQATPIPETSHLLLNTAVSTAKMTTPIKPTVRPPQPRRFVSGVSDRLMTRTAANQALIDDGSIRTRERVQKRQVERLARTHNSPVSRHKGKLFTAEDGIAKTRERMQRAQQKKLQLSHKQAVMDVKVWTPENTKISGSTEGSHSTVKRILTVPQAPKFATTARRGDRPPTGRSEVHSLAQSIIVFGKRLRDDISGSGSAGSHGSSQRSLTVPETFKLATDVLLGEKSKPPRSRSDVSLAQSSTILQNGLRAPYYPLSTAKTTGPTIPHSPKFQIMSNRVLPKSSMEKEVEEMEFFKAHPFKATSTPRDGPKRSFTENSSNDEGLPSFMRPTKGQVERTNKLPLQIKVFSTNNRASRVASIASALEAPKPFKARPAPLSTRQPPNPVSPSSLQVTKTLDRGVPAKMTATSRRRAEELARERDRRKSTSNTESFSVPSRRLTLTEPRPFSFATSTRTDRSTMLIRQEIN